MSFVRSNTLDVVINRTKYIIPFQYILAGVMFEIMSFRNISILIQQIIHYQLIVKH